MNINPDNSGESLADQAIDWLVQMRSGSVTDAMRCEFEVWYRQDDAHRQAYVEAEMLWGSVAEAVKAAPPANLPAGQLRSVPQAVAIRRRPRLAGLALAASLLLGAMLGRGMLQDWLLSDYATAVGEQQQIQLADGSSVLLNTDTALALDWSAERRRVVLLRGQAEFKVVADTHRPFEVVAGDTAVRALGTVFDVARRESGAVEVSVTEHAVAVRLTDKPDVVPMRVEEGQHLQYVGSGGLNKPDAANLKQLNAWKRGKLIFNDQALADVVTELNRYSKAKILLQGQEITHFRVSGVFPTDSLAMLDALQKSLSIRMTKLGPWLVILHM
ncbi:FecR family protein [Methylomonas albis]|uniref:FecR family protein n=1 Tax=Methylomonas albis TaxID=1854563 RepID=A0ABR9D5N9_9GAMM|nr:FecR family protein [Methylomonas albis]MBD9358442.1 FecR family protein [Methylomonas albis]